MRQEKVGNIGSLDTVIEHFLYHLKLNNSGDHQDRGHEVWAADRHKVIKVAHVTLLRGTFR